METIISQINENTTVAEAIEIFEAQAELTEWHQEILDWMKEDDWENISR